MQPDNPPRPDQTPAPTSPVQPDAGQVARSGGPPPIDPNRARLRSLLIRLPLFFVPVLTTAFFLGGGGSGGATAPAPAALARSAVQTSIPSARITPLPDKLHAYEELDYEAEQRERQLSLDPYATGLPEGGDPEHAPLGGDAFGEVITTEDRLTGLSSELDPGGVTGSPTQSDAGGPADELKLKLSEFQGELEAQEASQGVAHRGLTPIEDIGVSGKSGAMVDADDAKLAQMEAALTALDAESGAGPRPGSGVDQVPGGQALMDEVIAADSYSEPISTQDSLHAANLASLERVMDASLKLSNPALVEAELEARSVDDDRHVYPIAQANATAREVNYFGAAEPVDSLAPSAPSGFYGTGTRDGFEAVTVAAQVHATTMVTPGATVKLRLLDDVYLSGQKIPRSSFVYATTSLRRDRMALDIENVTYRGNIYPVKLTAYDLDGQDGVAVPASVEREVAKQQGTRSIGSLGRTGLGTADVAAQLALQGVDAARSLATAKMNAVKVQLKAGHRLILQNGQ